VPARAHAHAKIYNTHVRDSATDISENLAESRKLVRMIQRRIAQNKAKKTNTTRTKNSPQFYFYLSCRADICAFSQALHVRCRWYGVRNYTRYIALPSPYAYAYAPCSLSLSMRIFSLQSSSLLVQEHILMHKSTRSPATLLPFF
jgi:hypothetical protein